MQHRILCKFGSDVQIDGHICAETVYYKHNGLFWGQKDKFPKLIQKQRKEIGLGYLLLLST
jgi:hypothetical protein